MWLHIKFKFHFAKIIFQVEDALSKRGSVIGIPYWNWIKPNTKVPDLANEVTFEHPVT